MADEPVSDEESLDRLEQQDPAATVVLSGRYLDTLYDFAFRTSLDPTIAAASVKAGLEEGSFNAANKNGAAPGVSLLGLIRDEALERLRARTAGSGEDSTPVSSGDPHFSQLPMNAAGAQDSEVAAWAWQAARSQRPRDYSLLDLTVRRQLTPEEVSEAASMSQSGIYAVLGRLRGSFEDTFTATI